MIFRQWRWCTVTKLPITMSCRKTPSSMQEFPSITSMLENMWVKRPLQVLETARWPWEAGWRSEEHTSELQSLLRTSYHVFCLNKKNHQPTSSHYCHTHTPPLLRTHSAADY